MKIKYSKSRIFLNGALGATFAISGALKVYEGTAEFFHYIQLILGSLMVASFFLERKLGYLRINDGVLRKYWLGKKSLQLNKIIRIQSFPGNIKIFTSEEKLSINTELIAKHSRIDLLRVLGSLDVENNPSLATPQKLPKNPLFGR